MKKIIGKTAGDTFKLLGVEWKIIKITDAGYRCLAERLEEKKVFGDNNDWKESDIRKYLNGEFYDQLAAAVGEENIIPIERNLWSLDGQTEYGTCEDKVSLISVDEYRENRAMIPNVGYWWWTLTPDSTKCNNDSSWIAVVAPSGGIFYSDYYYDRGVRPFCIFSSSIFESEE